jgi:hypothetical protein
VEARGQGPEGEPLGGQKAKRGTTCGLRVKPPAANGPSECIQSLELVWVSVRESSSIYCGWWSSDAVFGQHARARGARGVERRSGYRKGEPSEGRSSRALPARNKAGKV